MYMVSQKEFYLLHS